MATKSPPDAASPREPSPSAASAASDAWQAVTRCMSLPRANVAAVVFACLAWAHGWLSGVTHQTSASRTFMLYALVGVSIAIPAWQNPVGRRVFVAVVYALSSAFIMAVSSSLAWYRNPKHAGHLPDIVHELVPYMDVFTVPGSQYVTRDGQPITIGGLELGESLLSGLVLVTVLWTLCNSWRWLALRRALVIYGTLCLWRSVTILVTSVPDASPRCTHTTPGTVLVSDMPWRDALARGMGILVGELTDPCRSAGDMVFSGHSMVLVLCGMVWHAYYRVKPGTFVINPVKFCVWCVISFALFVIVSARYHYTLDVVLAVYFAITLFNAYHRIADDVLIGHRFVAVWVLDGLVIYPAIEWLEAPSLGEARRAGMVSRNSRLMAQLAAARTALHTSPNMPPGAVPPVPVELPAGALPEVAVNYTPDGSGMTPTAVSAAEAAASRAAAQAYAASMRDSNAGAYCPPAHVPASVWTPVPSGGMVYAGMQPHGVLPHMHSAPASGLVWPTPQTGAPTTAHGVAAPSAASVGTFPTVSVPGARPRAMSNLVPVALVPALGAEAGMPMAPMGFLLPLPRATFGADGGYGSGGLSDWDRMFSGVMPSAATPAVEADDIPSDPSTIRAVATLLSRAAASLGVSLRTPTAAAAMATKTGADGGSTLARSSSAGSSTGGSDNAAASRDTTAMRSSSDSSDVRSAKTAAVPVALASPSAADPLAALPTPLSIRTRATPTASDAGREAGAAPPAESLRG